VNAKQTAMQYADSVLALVPQLIDQSIERRREHACWHELVARHRLGTCMRVNRWWWRLAIKRHGAKCAANKLLAEQCAMARARVRMSVVVVLCALMVSTVGCTLVDVDDVPEPPAPCRSDDECEGRCAGERVCTHDCGVDEQCDAGQSCIAGSCYTACDEVWPDCEGIGNACVGGVCGFESLECGGAEDCDPGYVCGDTRVCSLPCASEADCMGGLVCLVELGYCSDPCDSDDDCDLAPGAVCDVGVGVCWYAVE